MGARRREWLEFLKDDYRFLRTGEVRQVGAAEVSPDLPPGFRRTCNQCGEDLPELRSSAHARGYVCDSCFEKFRWW